MLLSSESCDDRRPSGEELAEFAGFSNIGVSPPTVRENLESVFLIDRWDVVPTTDDADIEVLEGGQSPPQ